MKKKAEPKRLFLGYSNQKILGRRKKFTIGAQVKMTAVRRQDAGKGMTQSLKEVEIRNKWKSQKEIGKVAKTS